MAKYRYQRKRNPLKKCTFQDLHIFLDELIDLCIYVRMGKKTVHFSSIHGEKSTCA